MPLKTPAGYAPLDIASIPAFLSRQPDIAARLGGQPGDWQVSEIGDGNLNLVFLVRGPAGGVCVKQALPYVRLVGESWPMPLQRAQCGSTGSPHPRSAASTSACLAAAAAVSASPPGVTSW